MGERGMEDRKCIVCGKGLTGGRRKYCSEKCYRKRNKERTICRRDEICYEEVRLQRERHRMSQEKISEVNRLARESGMTYGKYVAKMNAPAIKRRGNG